jgi:hypothetical protein
VKSYLCIAANEEMIQLWNDVGEQVNRTSDGELEFFSMLNI